jgi:hypothetical protein
MKSINAKGIISDLQNKIKKATIVGLDEEQMELLSKNGF